MNGYVISVKKESRFIGGNPYWVYAYKYQDGKPGTTTNIGSAEVFNSVESAKEYFNEHKESFSVMLNTSNAIKSTFGIKKLIRILWSLFGHYYCVNR